MKIIIKKILSQTDLSEQQCWWLLEHITKKTRTKLITTDYQLTKIEEKKVDQCIKAITIDHKPLAYILGFVPFLDLELIIEPPILIPRPETEWWVMKLIEMLKKSKQENITILDIGTGSGCIALSLAQAFPLVKIYAVDISPKALELTQKNAQNNNIKNINYIESNLFTNIPLELQFDLIVSNPPYIDPATKLEPCVTRWEDHRALFADNHGILIIEQIINQARQYLKKNNELEYQLVIEIDANQGAIIKKLSQELQYKNIKIQKDQFDRDRTIWLN